MKNPIGTLYEIQDKLNECRRILDNEMYCSGSVDINSHDFKMLRKVYDAICRVLDLM